MVWLFSNLRSGLLGTVSREILLYFFWLGFGFLSQSFYFVLPATLDFLNFCALYIIPFANYFCLSFQISCMCLRLGVNLFLDYFPNFWRNFDPIFVSYFCLFCLRNLPILPLSLNSLEIYWLYFRLPRNLQVWSCFVFNFTFPVILLLCSILEISVPFFLQYLNITFSVFISICVRDLTMVCVLEFMVLIAKRVLVDHFSTDRFVTAFAGIHV